MKKPQLSTSLAALALTLGIVVTTAGVIQAASPASSTATVINPMTDLVNALATKFNLKASDVQQVFDEQHAQMEARFQQKLSDRLAQAVKDGKLTQEQADKITAKLAELKTQRENNKETFVNKTQKERQTLMKEEMTSLQQWAKDNNIPMEYLKFTMEFHGKGPGHFQRGMIPQGK